MIETLDSAHIKSTAGERLIGDLTPMLDQFVSKHLELPTPRGFHNKLNKTFDYRVADEDDDIDVSILNKPPTEWITKHKSLTLYLRYKDTIKPWPYRTLIVAVIEVSPNKKGLGTELFNALETIARRHGFFAVGIECANPGIAAFAEKRGYRSLGHESLIKTLHD
ncbi:GNAT family N-acetyltransferase [Teredinibacter franksiae]|uniref:GNAT family N-acetyltransferase n=1 Tax=Teredinibacter franksiae TaxID=2761453 RepID=UPI0016280891|nr:GNAT family N-acetyltransferase [Teredinibacter franksiae]